MDNFQPMRFGQRLWIVPSWHAAPQPEAVNLLLDPGLAFGTGTHPTTALCLEWLDGQDLNDCTMIDFGCGSGILAIAALLLGAPQAIGTDIDPQALEASRDNAGRNGIDPARFPVYLPADMPQQPADVVVANILAGPLVSLAPQITAPSRPAAAWRCPASSPSRPRKFARLMQTLSTSIRPRSRTAGYASAASNAPRACRPRPRLG